MRFIWLHGFASGPSSSKGRFVGERLQERGVQLEVPDLNQPSFEGLTVSRMLGQVDVLTHGPEDADGTNRTNRTIRTIRPVVLFGSSLGGFTAATWAATRPGRATALVLLAPAFDLGRRWQERMPPADLARWRAEGRLAFDHYARGGKQELGIAFLDDALKHEPFPLPQCPTLVIQGARDEVVDPSLAREFTRRMQGTATLIELDQGHELTADLPGLWRLLEPFLQPWLPRPTP